MRKLEESSIDAIVTDPPYGLKFMGKEWDDAGDGQQQQEWHRLWAVEALRVLKPGGHLLAFGGSRTYHRLASAVEDAGFEIRDQIMWLYGSGFPKSLNVSKAIDKHGGYPHLAKKIGAAIKEAREKRGLSMSECDKLYCGGTTNWSWYEGRPTGQRAPDSNTFKMISNDWPELAKLADVVKEAAREVVGTRTTGIGTGNGSTPIMGDSVNKDLTAPATSDAKKWSGWGTALKPAHEPIVVARKPLIGTVAANVLEHGTGALNIDGCRVEEQWGGSSKRINSPETKQVYGTYNKVETQQHDQGRWPANIILDEEAGALLDEQSGERKSGGRNGKRSGKALFGNGSDGTEVGNPMSPTSGGASRFFYCPKAGKKERNAGLDGFEYKRSGTERMNNSDGRKEELNESDRTTLTKNIHPTVKPIALMAYLCRLVTPPGGTILDPFLGSGSTGCAAIEEGFDFIGIEREKEYVAICQARLAYWANQTPN